MLKVISTGVFWTLNRSNVFIAAFEHQPVDVFISLILVSFDAIPSEDKVLGDIVDTVTRQAHCNIVPGHASIISFVEFVVLPVLHALKVHDTVVVEVLAWENLVLDTGRVNVREWVLVVVPSTETEINATDKCNRVVDHGKFFVVCL